MNFITPLHKTQAKATLRKLAPYRGDLFLIAWSIAWIAAYVIATR